MTRSSETLAQPIKTKKKTMIFKLWLEIKNSRFFIGFYNGFHGQELRNISKPIKTMENHDQEPTNIGTANKNQKTMIFKLWLEIKNSRFFIGFYNVSELLTMKTIAKTNKKP